MLWAKGWYETRPRLLFVLAVILVIVGVAWRSAPAEYPTLQLTTLDATTLIGASGVAALMLAGAGIKTHPGGFRPKKGLHGSMYYTLSLPVTRRRLFSVRVLLGLAETAVIHVLVCCAAWLVVPVIRLNVAPSDMFKQGVAAFFYVAAIYSLGVLFAAFLDDLYQVQATMLTMFVTMQILRRVHLPTFMDNLLISPIITHTMPWNGMAVLLALSGMLLLISLKIVQSREY